MDCICLICEKVPQGEHLRNLAEHATVFYNLTSFQISEREDLHLLKLCSLCEEKLLKYDVFRTLCVEVCTKLKQSSQHRMTAAAPTLVKIENEDSHINQSDDELVEYSKLATECSVEAPAGKAGIIEDDVCNNDIFRNELHDDDEEYRNETHENSNESSKNIQPACHLCGKSFRNQNNLDGHIRVHQGLKPALCKLCGKAFIRWHSLKLHTLRKHTERIPGVPRATFPCDFDGCESSFASKQGMLRHRKKHDPAYTKPVADTFVCELCGKTFSSKGSLQKHSYIHTGNMPFHCDVCNKRYPTAHKLKEHTMRHQGIKNHSCPHCGLKKTTMHELRVHMNYHTKEKTFPCEFCKKVFMNTGNLATHVKTVHQRLTPFKCTHCSRSFGKKESLKRHIMMHTGERPHECTTCGKRFIQLVALQSHSKIHTK